MSTTEPTADSPPPKPKWYQYRLRSLFILMLLVSLGLSWLAVKMQQAQRQREAVEAIRDIGGYAVYDYLDLDRMDGPPSGSPPGPSWLRAALGIDFVARVVAVHLAIPQVTDDVQSI